MKRVFYGVFSLCLAAILTVAVLRPQNNLIPSRMFLYMLVCAAVLCGIRAALSFLENDMDRKGWDKNRISHICLAVYTVLYGICIYIVSLILRSYPVTDYGNVYFTAYDLAAGRPVEDWSYFSMWTNNLGVLTLLASCMRLGMRLGFAEPYYFVLGLNVIQVMAALVSIYYLAGKIGAKSVSRQWFAVAVYTFWLPVWTCTNAFYSDQMSFGGSVTAVALGLYAHDLRGRRDRKMTAAAAALAAGVIWGVGVTAKATSAVALVALAVTLLLRRNRRDLDRKQAIAFLLALTLTAGGLSVISKGFPSREDEHRLKMPTEYWLAMGLMGNGSYAENEDLVQQCYRCKNVDVRRDFCREMIRENWKNMFQAQHLMEKTAMIFASGDISPTSHIYPYEESLLWHWVYWEGDYYWKYACLTTGYFYAVMLFMLLGALLRTFNANEGESGLAFMTYLTVFGLFVFLMLWEAQNKQLYNHISWMTLAAVCGAESLMILIRRKGRR